MSKLKAPFPWFGGKRKVADLVWQRFGQLRNYVEPFFGGGAVMLARPGWTTGAGWVETVNDADLFLTNFWRAVQADPLATAGWCDYPVSEVDLTARHRWLVADGAARLRALDMENSVTAYDAQVAGWWVWGICQWIGSGWCDTSKAPEELWQRYRKNRMAGVHVSTPGAQKPMPHAEGPGRGINASSVRGQIPDVSANTPGRGVLGMGLRNGGVLALFEDLQDRLRHVRVCSGDWSRVVTNSATHVNGRVLTGVFLDPPYDGHGAVYRTTSVSAQVNAWCVENGAEPMLRIALCGYDDEHQNLEEMGWSCVAWKAAGGYGNRRNKDGQDGNHNAHRERIWFSPHCLDDAQLDLWSPAPASEQVSLLGGEA